MNKENEQLLIENGWDVECESPFEIRHNDGSFASGQGAIIILDSLKEQPSWLDNYLEDVKEEADEIEKLVMLNDIASDIGNQFSYDMGKLEDLIYDTLDEVSLEAKKETNYFKVEDITQNISVRPSNKWK